MKLVIFDLDGVLVKTSHIHTSAFRQAALRLFSDEIAMDPILDASNGQRTVDKLEELRTKYNLTDADIVKFGVLKHELTLKQMHSIEPTNSVTEAVRALHDKGYILTVASNSRRQYVNTILDAIDLSHFISHTVAGDEISKPKPDPEIFERIMNLYQKETVVFEDSDIGIHAATVAGAKVIKVDPSKLLTLDETKGA